MKIQTVFYQYLANLGHYENARIGAEAKVEQGETPQQALANVKEWVLAQIAEQVAAGWQEHLTKEIKNLKDERDALIKEVTALRNERYFMDELRAAQTQLNQVMQRVAEIKGKPTTEVTSLTEVAPRDSDDDFDEDDDD